MSKASNKKKNERKAIAKQTRRANGVFKCCPNCQEDIEDGGHFAPGMNGRPGFFICQ